MMVSFMKIKKMNKTNILVYLVMAVVFILASYPYLQSGYYGDDILNSSIRGEMNRLNLNFVQITMKHIVDFIKIGRWFPLVILQQDLVFYFLNNLVIYKIFLLIISFLSIFCVTKFIAYYYANKNLSYIAGILMVLCFPYYTPGSNSMNMYAGLVQLQIILMILCIYYALRQIETDEKRTKIISYGIYCLAMLHYETSFLILPVIMILTYKNLGSVWNTVKRLKAYISITTAAVALNIGIRYYASTTIMETVYDGIQVQINISKMVQAFFVQFLGALPMYSNINSNVSILNWEAVFDSIEIVEVIVLFLILGVIVWMFFRKISKLDETVLQKVKTNGYLALASMVLWAGCAALISLSKKYQVELAEARAPHIPVLIEFFFCFLFFLSLMKLTMEVFGIRKLFVHIILQLLTLLSVFIFCMNSILVQQTVEQGNAIYKQMREAYNDALNQGLADWVEDDAIIIIDISYSPVIYPNLFYEYINRNIKVYRMDQFVISYSNQYNSVDSNIIINEGNNPIYITKSFIMEGQRVVYLDRVKEFALQTEQNSLNSIVTKQLFVYKTFDNENGLDQINELAIMSDSNWILMSQGQGKSLNHAIWKSATGNYDYSSYAFWQ